MFIFLLDVFSAYLRFVFVTQSSLVLVKFLFDRIIFLLLISPCSKMNEKLEVFTLQSSSLPFLFLLQLLTLTNLRILQLCECFKVCYFKKLAIHFPAVCASHPHWMGFADLWGMQSFWREEGKEGRGIDFLFLIKAIFVCLDAKKVFLGCSRLCSAFPREKFPWKKRGKLYKQLVLLCL